MKLLHCHDCDNFCDFVTLLRLHFSRAEFAICQSNKVRHYFIAFMMFYWRPVGANDYIVSTQENVQTTKSPQYRIADGKAFMMTSFTTIFNITHITASTTDRKKKQWERQ